MKPTWAGRNFSFPKEPMAGEWLSRQTGVFFPGRIPLAPWFAWMAFFFLLPACGYHFPGKAAGLPAEIRSVAVPVFANRTIQTGIETTVTRVLVDRIVASKRLAVTEQKSADALLSGTVESFVTSPIAVTSGTQITTEYRATISVAITLTRQRDGKVLWKGGGISEWRNYPVSANLLLTEANKQEAIRQISVLLAERIRDLVLEDF